jgi:hypothetical protein
MIIITENNYKPFVDIIESVNPEQNPNIILYPEIFNNSSTTKITKLLKTLKYYNNQSWFVDKTSFLHLRKIFTNIFPSFLEYIRNDLENITDLVFNSCLITRYKGDVILNNSIPNNLFNACHISPTFFFGDIKKLMFFSNKNNDSVRKLDINSGSMLLERENFSNNWRIKVLGNMDEWYTVNFKLIKEHDITKVIGTPITLSSIYLNTDTRHKNSVIVMNSIQKIHDFKKEGSDHVLENGIDTLKRYITFGKLIGTGDWGNVYSVDSKKDKDIKFALKLSRITNEDLQNPYSETSSSWNETYILRDILKPLIVKNICPNLPLFIDTFLCNKYDFIFRKGNNTHPCVITAIELANGDMRDYLKLGSPNIDELYCALFHVMIGLHAIQMSGQILNNDIKSKNILFYNVTPGGYWHYRIDECDFYVPNYGKMFILNDFGVSTIYNPNFQLYSNKKRKLYSLGSRYAINIGGIFSPINSDIELLSYNLNGTDKIKWVNKNGKNSTSNGITYKIDRKSGNIEVSNTVLTSSQKSYLLRNGISTDTETFGFFEHPYIIPPFEFYNDTQDVLRMFIGGKRSTQKGNHTVYTNIPEDFKDQIKPYLGISDNIKEKSFSPFAYHVLAGLFIKKFFTETYSYRLKPKGQKIGYYDMNKCL